MSGKAIVITIIKGLLISFLWKVLELIFYGEIQPRIVDDIIYLFLVYYIYKSEILSFLVFRQGDQT